MKKPSEPDHPAVASAKRAIRRTLSRLTPAQAFTVAAFAETLAYGEDRGRWALSASYAADNPDHRWKCDEPSATKRGAR